MNALDAAIMTRLNVSALTSLLAGTTSAYPCLIYKGQAQENTPYPYVVFNIQGGGDENKSPHRSKNLVLFIRAYSKVSAYEAGTIDLAIDTLCHLSPLSGVTGYTNIWFARETDLENVENPPTGTRIFMQGGLYRNRLAQ